jgi:serine/threonine protein phosphatase 1
MIYILSDIHGNRRRFNSIMTQIDLKSEDTLYVLGDVIDRHPEGIGILRQLMAMPNVKMLPGNHEYMMLRALGQPYDDNVDNGTALAHWYRNGGEVTHEHFALLEEPLQQQIIDYLRALPLEYELELNGKTWKLVHGGPVSAYVQDPKYFGPTHFAVWKRWNLNDAWPEDCNMIFGHTPTRYYRDIVPMEIWYQGRHIGIDCGGGYPEDPAQEHSKYGRLACLRLDDGKVFYSVEN